MVALPLSCLGFYSYMSLVGCITMSLTTLFRITAARIEAAHGLDEV